MVYLPLDHCSQEYKEGSCKSGFGLWWLPFWPEATGFSLTLVHTSGGIRTLDETNSINLGNDQTSRTWSVGEHSDLLNPYIDFVCHYWSRLSSKFLTSTFPSTRQNARHRTAMYGVAGCEMWTRYMSNLHVGIQQYTCYIKKQTPSIHLSNF